MTECRKSTAPNVPESHVSYVGIVGLVLFTCDERKHSLAAQIDLGGTATVGEHIAEPQLEEGQLAVVAVGAKVLILAVRGLCQ